MISNYRTEKPHSMRSGSLGFGAYDAGGDDETSMEECMYNFNQQLETYATNVGFNEFKLVFLSAVNVQKKALKWSTENREKEIENMGEIDYNNKVNSLRGYVEMNEALLDALEKTKDMFDFAITNMGRPVFRRMNVYERMAREAELVQAYA
jgi:hypothetical protein